MILAADDPVALAATEAVHRGDVDTLRKLLDEHSGWPPRSSASTPTACRGPCSTPRPTGQAISRTTPLDAAARNETSALVDWLRARGAVPTADP
jgi:hypothetical protein